MPYNNPSKRVSLYWCVSRYLRVAGLDSFLPKATPYGLGVGRQESNSPPHSPSPYEAEGEKNVGSPVLRSMPPHKLRLLTSPTS